MIERELLLTEVNDLREMNDEDGAAYWALSEAIRAERMPDDPPTPYAMFAARMRSVPSFVTISALLARESPGGPVIAAANIGFDTSGENAHLAQFDIEVLPEHRRRGVGRRLLAWAADIAQRHGRRLLLTASHDSVPAGRAFVERIGARPGLEDRESQLVLAEVNRDLLARWQADAATAAAGFELILWDDIYPEEDLVAFADLCEVMNTAPRGELDIEDQKVTPEKVREFMASNRARGSFVWTIIARELATGRMAGFSEIFGNPGRPTILNQGATAVRPEFRGHRLGRWMKAAMLEKVLADRPEARLVRTGNASSNAPMLAINIDLGFKPYMHSTVWQVETETAIDYANVEC
ncbi:GNAT family N-acetyltransferase [Oscillochloris sp. ZM17-4]|uniref:GNAT family N-acetyltransferase n=1 Tax=Oscillochloris sp. ZM17-4 TaxID=2866714 RepID=UPI001C72F9DA|nr:GNAT family N-acetyltransferase [Oscillochloris sp. ZM17-4]MBX0328451.1 GNAT family N-acetyltransferase [Oscillochloris sp. ZM17-4]